MSARNSKFVVEVTGSWFNRLVHDAAQEPAARGDPLASADDRCGKADFSGLHKRRKGIVTSALCNFGRGANRPIVRKYLTMYGRFRLWLPEPFPAGEVVEPNDEACIFRFVP